MEFRHLKYFVAVADELNFTRAARKLNISQPPLTKQIKDLEQELEVILFERNKHKVSLTAAGKVFLKRARSALNFIDSTVDDVRKVSQSRSDTLTMGFMSAVMLAEFSNLLKELHRVHPDVSIKFVQMRSNEQLEALEDGRIDFGFGDLNLDALSSQFQLKDMYSDQILHERLWAAVPQNSVLAKRKSISLSDLKNERFAILERHLFPSNYDTVIMACKNAGFSPRITDYGDQTPTVLAYVASNMCVSLAPECSIEAWSDHVAFIPLKEVFHVDIFMIYRKIQASPVIMDIRKIIKQLYPRESCYPKASQLKQVSDNCNE